MSYAGGVRVRLKQAALSRYQDLLVLRSYFDPALRSDPKAHWLLIFTPPNSGSTALAELVGRSKSARRLTANGEGQWLIPELAREPDRMMRKPLVSARRLRAVWLDRLRGRSAEPYVVVEKSPASLFRWRHISAALEPMPQTRLVLVRDPLATVASWVKRYGAASAPRLWHGEPPAADREGQLRGLAQVWLQWARCLIECREEAHLFVRYEDLCDDPERVIGKLRERVPILSDIDVRAPLAVKDYRPQALENMNAASLLTLGEGEREVVSEELRTQSGLLEALGYSAGRAGLVSPNDRGSLRAATECSNVR